MKAYSNVIAIVISAVVIFSYGYRVQSSANEVWQAKSAALVSARGECIERAKKRMLSDEASIVLFGQSLAFEAETCGMMQRPAEMAAFDEYESRMNAADMFLVSGIVRLICAFFAYLAIKDRKSEKVAQTEFVRMRVTSFQRRARKAKRENALRQLELVRS